MAVQIPAVSVEYVHVPVTASVDLGNQVVEIAFLASTATAPDANTAWIAAEWLGSVGLSRTCRVLIGPGTAVVLTAGTHNVWVRITDTPEAPVRQAGQLKII